MLFKRLLATNNAGLPQVSRQGLGMLGNISVTTKNTNVDHTITVDEMSGGCIYYDSLSAGRAVTTPTAALILAACPDMDIGDSFCFWVAIQDAFAITWAAGASVTLAGRATTAASGSSMIVVVKTSATTVTWFVL
jgi:hypothetical protein